MIILYVAYLNVLLQNFVRVNRNIYIVLLLQIFVMVKTKEKKEGLFEYHYNIIKKDKKFLFILFAVLFVVYSFLVGLWKISIFGFGINRLSAVGFLDYLFLLGTSALISAFVVLWRHERKTHIQSLATAGVAGGGLAKKLIIEHNFSAEQIVDIRALFDSCGGTGHEPGVEHG